MNFVCNFLFCFKLNFGIQMAKGIFLICIFLHVTLGTVSQVKLFVSTNGVDTNEGTAVKPFRTIHAAVARAMTYQGEDVILEVRKGVYHLEKTIEINASSFKPRSFHIRGFGNEHVLISGAQRVKLSWQPHKNGIVKAYLDLDIAPDRFFINGRSQPMARYPNYDSAARNFNGTATDAISDERIKKWRDPAGGFIHALHNGEWGGFHYRITGKSSDGELAYEGGWQNNRPAPMHQKHRFVEHVYEELDAPGEWFYDNVSKTLYFYPEVGLDLYKAEVAVSKLTDLIRITGTADNPVKHISISNITFTQNSRSFMQTKEPLLRSDWTIYRGGAILLDGTENIEISNCRFFDLGGNAIFLSNYNRNNRVVNNHINNIGGSAIAFVGSAEAVRSPAFRYEFFVPWDHMDFTPGPKTNAYPQHCSATGNLIHDIGTIEKQVAGVQIAMSSHITVSHNSIYNTPRSGINIGDGCWGGHLIEHNDVFNTVLETGDHGAFNSWGRDRFWSPNRKTIDSMVKARPGIELLDVVAPITIRNNRFQCDHGWDIDLDDGSSHYKIYNNVCLSGGLKLREGYHRKVYNNILVNNTFHPHVWLKNSGDTFMHNIVTAPYAPIQIEDWGKKIDSNFFLVKEGLIASQGLGNDLNSKFGDALFLDAASGNYRVATASPALTLGFENFAMAFGVSDPALKKLAQTPKVKPLITTLGATKGELVEWLGATWKNVETLGERSAAGLPDNKGALLVDLQPNSIAAKSRLQQGDVIIHMGKQEIHSIRDLLNTYQQVKWMGGAACTLIRNQAEIKMRIEFN
jgi:hypothetical protein